MCGGLSLLFLSFFLLSVEGAETSRSTILGRYLTQCYEKLFLFLGRYVAFIFIFIFFVILLFI